MPSRPRREFRLIPLSQLEPWKEGNARKTDVFVDISDLARNIQENALQVPLIVYEKEVEQEPIVKGLGIRANEILILHEGACVKVKQRTWLDKKDWREIHDILRTQGFNWLANGRDSCWIRPSHP